MKSIFSNSLQLAGIASLFALLPASGQGLEIDWGTSAQDGKVITSSGSAVLLSEFSVELGGFGGGFVPTQSNTSDWVSNWQVFDAITENDTDTSGVKGARADFYGNGTGTDARFVGTGYLQSDQTSNSEDSNGLDTFGPNQQAYVFIRNSDTPDGSAEWLLYTSETGEDWEYPAVVDGQPAIAKNWFLAEADTAVWGGVNGTINGGGVRSDTSTDFILRTHSFAAVPEPSTTLLFVSGALALLRRRRRG